MKMLNGYLSFTLILSLIGTCFGSCVPGTTPEGLSGKYTATVVSITAETEGMDAPTESSIVQPTHTQESGKPPFERPYWPTDGWKHTTPEEQGMDSEMLAEMLARIKEDDYNIHSVLVARHGYLVTEAYKHPFHSEAKHIIYSCTKSVVSALIGIAIDEGYIEGVNQPVLSFFPEMEVANLDANKEAMTLKNLLTMASGLRCRDSYIYQWSGLREMTNSPDWAKYVLDLPMSEAPGTRFEYCNGVSQILSRIITVTTDKSALEFAEEHLFSPLGISDVYWSANSQGVNIGAYGLQLKAADMAKIGHLYLNQGWWDGKQVVPSAWVEASTSAHIHAATLQDDYGYQWWIDNSGIYMALGFAGQFIFVVPEEQLVVVFTSGLSGSDFDIPERLLKTHIIPSVKADNQLPENPDGVDALKAQVEALVNPEPNLIPPLPEMAKTVSGKRYGLENNSLDFEALSLSFEEGSSEAQLLLTTYGEELALVIGLDGVFRVTPHEQELNSFFLHTPIALKGYWQDENTFMLYFQNVGSPDDISFRMIFNGDEVVIHFFESTTSDSRNMRGHVQE